MKIWIYPTRGIATGAFASWAKEKHYVTSKDDLDKDVMSFKIFYCDKTSLIENSLEKLIFYFIKILNIISKKTLLLMSFTWKGYSTKNDNAVAKKKQCAMQKTEVTF